MKTGIKNRIGNWQNKKSILIGILVFGSIWGLLESTLGGYLSLHAAPWMKLHWHMCLCPWIVGTIGILILASALAIYKKPGMLIGIGLVAVAFKWLTVPIHGVSATSFPVIMPAIAICIESAVFALLAALLMRRLGKGVPAWAAVGALTGLLSSVAWIYAHVGLGTPIFKATGLSGPAAFIATEGMLWMALCAIFLPLGYLAGTKLQPGIASLLTRKPTLSYGVSAGLVAFCWGISAVALATVL